MINISPRTGRPKEENAKRTQVVVRLSDEDVEKLDECAKHLNETRAETLRVSLRTLHEAIKK